MKYLIVSDIHDRIELVNAILNEWEAKVDKVIFLGDYFDSFGHGQSYARRTAEWLKSHLDSPNKIFLLGNHDLHYWHWRRDDIKCSGYNSTKCNIINHILTEDDWRKLQFYHRDGRTVFTHAGVHPEFFGYDHQSIEHFEGLIEKAKVPFKFGAPSKVIDSVGYFRGGHHPYGGILWLTFGIEFEPTPYINQFFGHTADVGIRMAEDVDSRNICMDTHNQHVILWDSVTDEFKIEDTSKFGFHSIIDKPGEPKP